MKRVVSYISVLMLLFLNQVNGQEACIEIVEKDQDYTISTGIVAPPLEAASVVTLKDGVWVQNGSEFVAQITDCTAQAENNIDDTDDGLSNTTQNASGNNIWDTQGVLSVNEGKVNYNIPIALPPSIKGFVPNISLNYTSGQISGIAGMGWNISGLSSITRVGKKFYLDGERSGVTFTTNDKLALGGQRLVLKTGNYWESGSTYETERFSNIKIELQGTGDNISFIVTAPDGTRSWYGKNTWGGTDGIGVTDYYLVRTEDINGNYITYDYFSNNHTIYLDKISFSANKKLGDTPINEVEFIYENSGTEEVAYINGLVVKKTKRLKTIQINTKEQSFRKYELTYTEDSVLGYATLTQVQEYNGAGEASNPIQLEYDTTESGEVEEFTKTYLSDLDFESINISGDFDGDGRVDFTVADKLYNKLFNGNSSGSAPIQLPTTMDFSATAIDPNTQKLNPHKSLVKLVTENVEKPQFHVYNFVGGVSTFSYAKEIDIDLKHNVIVTGLREGVGPAYSCKALLEKKYEKKNPKFITGDFNGDGITEVIVGVEKDVTKVFDISNVDSAESCQDYTVVSNPSTIEKDYYIYNLDINESSTLGTSGFLKITDVSGLLDTDRKQFLFDYDGDGLTDIMMIDGSGNYGILSIKRTNNQAFTELIATGIIDSYTNTKEIKFGDFNGDGKTDILMPETNEEEGCLGCDNWHIYFANPNQLNQNLFLKETHSIVDYRPKKVDLYNEIKYCWYYVLDLNMDGKSDLLRIHMTDGRFSDKKRKETVWTAFAYINRLNSEINKDFANTATFYGSSRYGDDMGAIIPMPLSLDRYGLVSDLVVIRPETGEIEHIDFSKDVLRDASLKKVISLGGEKVEEIEYKGLEAQNNIGNNELLSDELYSSSGNVKYPYTEAKCLPKFRVVSKLFSTFNNETQIKEFRYHGLVANLLGKGGFGFSKVASSDWYIEGSNPEKWNVYEKDHLLNGVIKRSYSQLINQGDFTFYPSSQTLSGIPGIISSSENTYEESTQGKVHKLLLKTQTGKNYLTGVKTETVNTYDSTYANVEQIVVKNFHNNTLQGEIATVNTYDNNPNGTDKDYFIGRITKKETTRMAYGDTKKSSAEYIYANNKLIETKMQANNTDGQYLSNQYMYDLYGNVVKETNQMIGGNSDVLPLITTYTYDNTGRYIKTTTNPFGQTSTIETFHPIYGSVTKAKGNNTNLIHQTIYDHWGNPIEEIDYLGRKKIYKYSRSNGLITVEEENEDGSKSKTVTNALGQVVESSKNNLNGVFSSIAYKYDFKGRRTETSEPYSDGTPSAWNETTYDQYGRVEQQQFASSKTVDYTYDDLTTTVSDGIKTTSTTIDANGYNTSASDPGGTINYTYNANGQLKTSTYGNSVQTIEYDDWGRKTKLIDPSAGVYTYEYDAYDNIVKENTPLGSTEYGYDQYGRTISKINKNQAGIPIITTTSTYDSEKHLLSRMDVVSEGETMTYTYSYDGFDRLTFKGEETPHVTFNKAYTYDGFGRIYKELNTAVNKVNNSYQSTAVHNLYKNGYHWKIEDDTTNELLWSNDEYSNRGQLKQGTYGNGLKTFYKYDSFGFPQEIIHGSTETAETDSNETHINTFKYVFNSTTANLTSRTITGVQTVGETFLYDNLDRLTKVSYSGGGERTYTYDLQGRIDATSKLGDYHYNDNNSPYQLSKIDLNPVGQQYQATQTNQNVLYNSFKRPVRIEQENKEVIYFSYNTFEQRSAMYYGDTGNDKMSKKLRKYYSHDGSKELIYDTATQETTFVTYIGGDAYTAPLIVKGDGSSKEYLYLHRDHQGSITAITNQNGDVLESRLFDAWGDITLIKDGQGNTLSKLTVLDRGYTGHEHLQKVGLINMNGRLYDAKTHRFLSPDNYIQDPTNTQNFNRYSYVLNNPLKYTDSSGEWWEYLVYAAFIYAKGAHDNKSEDGKWNWNPFKWEVVPFFGAGTSTNLEDPNLSTTASVYTSPTGSNATYGMPITQFDLGKGGVYTQGDQYLREIMHSNSNNPKKTVPCVKCDQNENWWSKIRFYGDQIFGLNKNGDIGGIDGEITGTQDFNDWVFPSGPSAAIKSAFVQGGVAAVNLWSWMGSVFDITDKSMELYNEQVVRTSFVDWTYKNNPDKGRYEVHDTTIFFYSKRKYLNLKNDSLEKQKWIRYRKERQRAFQLYPGP